MSIKTPQVFTATRAQETSSTQPADRRVSRLSLLKISTQDCKFGSRFSVRFAYRYSPKKFMLERKNWTKIKHTKGSLMMVQGGGVKAKLGINYF